MPPATAYMTHSSKCTVAGLTVEQSRGQKKINKKSATSQNLGLNQTCLVQCNGPVKELKTLQLGSRLAGTVLL